MARLRILGGVAAGCLLCCVLVASADAAPSVEQVLLYKPKQNGVRFDTPTAAEQANCEVKLVRGKVAGSSGWLLFDKAKNRPLRRFFDSDGDKRIDIYSYYKNGLEVYREIDANGNNAPEQYRWFNSGGMKWGIDSNEDGRIDSWRMISADEVALEAFEALRTRDAARLHALLISEAELQSLGLPEAYVKKIRAKLEKTQERFQKAVEKAKIPAAENTTARVESATPQCVPGESIGVAKDLYRFPSRTVLYTTGDKQFHMVSTGEMLKLGMAWRLLDVPMTGNKTTDPTPQNNVMQKLMEQLAQLDSNVPPQPPTPGPNRAVVDWNLQRVAIIDKMLPTMPANEKAIWLKQKADNLSQAAIHSAKGDTNAIAALRNFRDSVLAQDTDKNMVAYLTYRVLWSEYAPKIAGNEGNIAENQAAWLKELAKFAQDFPKAEDTPDVLYQYAMGSEFGGKEDEAKKAYRQLVNDFPKHPMAARAAGAVRRLDLVGQTLELTGQTLQGSNFSAATQRGKVYVVYYWASWCTNCAASFEKLQKLRKTYAAKGFEVVTVSLDDQAAQAVAFLQKNPVVGYHLFSESKEGGMSSPLATQYGIMGLPTMFLVGKDGTVISRNMQINDLEDAIRKGLE